MGGVVWNGIFAGVLAATVILGFAGAAYRVGQQDEVVTRMVGDGEVVRVVGASRASPARRSSGPAVSRSW